MTTPTEQWPGYQPPASIIGYAEPIAAPDEHRDGQVVDDEFLRKLTRAVGFSMPRMATITSGTPGDGQILTGAPCDATNGQVNLNAPLLPKGAVIGYERPDNVTANLVVITMTLAATGTTSTHTLRFKGHQVVLISRGDGTWDKLANWLSFDGLKALFDSLYASGGTVVDQGVITNGAHTPSLAGQQQATFTTTAPTIATPAVSGVTPANGARVYGRYLVSGASLLVTLGGSPVRSQAYPASLQVPAGRRVRVLWEYSTLGTVGWTVVLFSVEQ